MNSDGKSKSARVFDKVHELLVDMGYEATHIADRIGARTRPTIGWSSAPAEYRVIDHGSRLPQLRKSNNPIGSFFSSSLDAFFFPFAFTYFHLQAPVIASLRSSVVGQLFL